MAKHQGKGRQRTFKRYIRGAIEHGLNLSTLGAKVLIGSNNSDVVTERAYVSSVVARWALQNMTASSGDGPIMCGVAHSDYTDAEIEEWVENDASWEEADQIGQEVAKRKIRQVGIFPRMDTSPLTPGVLNDGKPVRTKCGWILTTGQTLKFWAYNAGTNALETTDPLMTVLGHANIWPA